MKIFMYVLAFGYLLPALIIHLFETFVPSYNKTVEEVANEGENDEIDDFVDPQLFRDFIKWCPILNFIAAGGFIYYGIKSIIFPEPKCSTCGGRKNDLTGKFCSNSFHLDHKKD